MPQDMPPAGGYEAVQYKVRIVDWNGAEFEGVVRWRRARVGGN
jgi:hypothetical protein